MTEFPENTKFKYPWRSYQLRTLDNMESYFTDNHLHIIAPPGSGKTILGLEVARRLNKPTLIFSPTITIRNQWIHKFCEFFLGEQEPPSWISTDIRKPEFLTVVTYQSLYSAALEESRDETSEYVDDIRKEKNIDVTKLVEILSSKHIETIIMDEAHHLKREWWKALDALKSRMNVTFIGLTATPPYDVSYSEWLHYIDLNGIVDKEISIPELMQEHDLCPHQDYVFLSEPTVKESQLIEKQRMISSSVFQKLKEDKNLIHVFSEYPVIKTPETNYEWIYKNIELYLSILMFLKNAGIDLPKIHLKILDVKK